MNLNDVVKEVISEKLFSSPDEKQKQNNIGNFVIVRTYSAGVHCGYLRLHNGKEVHLKDARRIWRWKGANTLNEMSLNGCDEDYSRISEPVKKIELTEAIEVIPCEKSAIENLSTSRWGN